MRTLIFAAGKPNTNESINKILREDDIIIAADGGANFCLEMGINPDFAVGDFDSISTKSLEKLELLSVSMIRHPSRKDYTDLELALQHACRLGSHEILIFGGLGLRWDQTLANILLIASSELTCKNIRLLDDNQELILVTQDSPADLVGKPGDTVSLIPIKGDAVGITTKNLEYPLNNETLFFSATRGVSNVMTEYSASVSVSDGLLICTIIHH